MTNIRTTELDNGRLIVNVGFRELLEANGLTTFKAIMNFSGGTIVKQALKERYTTRITLKGSDGDVRFFLKRYKQPPIKEFLKQIIRFTRPITGAKNEWEALLFLNRCDIPSAVPVAYGSEGGHSFTLTLAIENVVRVSDWFEAHPPSPADSLIKDRRIRLVSELAHLVRTLHDTGVNHQDLYLCHFLVNFSKTNPELFIIDTQRAMIHQGKLPSRWKVKDLAQFCFSASCLDQDELELFFKFYGLPKNQRILEKIDRKIKKIRRHSIKNQL